MSLEETIRRSISRAGIVRVRNVLNPLLWMCVSVPGPSWSFAYAFRDDTGLRDLLVGLGCLPVLASLCAYFIFAFKNPDRLQSEEFVLRQRELSLVERKGPRSPELPTDVVDTDDSKLRRPDTGVE